MKLDLGWQYNFVVFERIDILSQTIDFPIELIVNDALTCHSLVQYHDQYSFIIFVYVVLQNILFFNRTEA
jgi:hypothetical protein